MESRRKRVEQKGRFTITEIIPGSPYSSRLSSPTFQDDEVSVADFPAADGAPASNGSCSEVAMIQPQPAPPQQLKPVESNELGKPASKGAVELKTEEPPETHTQPPEAVSASESAPIEASLIIVTFSFVILLLFCHGVALEVVKLTRVEVDGTIVDGGCCNGFHKRGVDPCGC